MFRIIQSSRYWVAVSAVLCAASLVVWLMWGLNLGIDFTGGAALEVVFEQRPSSEQLSEALVASNVTASQTITAGDNGYILRFQELSNTQKDTILASLASYAPQEKSFVTIGPSIGNELKKKSFLAIGFVLLAIVLYISYTFSGVSRGPIPSWMFGFAAIVALAHDIIIPVGVFSVLGHYMHVQVDGLFVTALLTILGFSIHDTIVVFDRIRESLKMHKNTSFAEIINTAINTTLSRSINTSLTTLIVLVALYAFGGESIRWFVLTLIIGIVAGTYSSIFIASPTLLLGERLLNRKKA